MGHRSTDTRNCFSAIIAKITSDSKILGMLHRNCRHLNALRNSVTNARMESDLNVATTESPPKMNSQVTTEMPNVTCSKSGRNSATPSRLVEDHDWH